MPFTLDALTPAALLPATPRGTDEQRRLARKSPLEVAREFEAILVAQVIGAMRKTVSATGLFGGDAASKVLDGAFDQELARDVAKGAHLGLAETLAAQIARHRDATQTAGTATDAARAVTATPLAGAHATPDAAADGAVASELVAGAAGRVTSGFGVRRDPITGTRAFHNGIDVAAPRGSAIHAVAGGEVVFSGRRGRAGNVVEVRDGDLVSAYAHVDRTLVHAGQKVAAGDVLATVGSTGRATGPHVHFALLRDGQAVDPAAVLAHDPTAAAAPPAPAGDSEES